MLLLGIDIGTSSVKVCVVDAESQSIIASAQYPDAESPIISLQTGWAEQSPDMWWQQTQQALALCIKKVVSRQKMFLQLASLTRCTALFW